MITTTSTNDVSISVLPLGGAGPRLLFVHATGFCSTVWRPFAAALADRFECWAVDIRSHGHSTTQSDGSFAWEATGDDVLAAVDAIDAAHGRSDRAWLGVGHSMGGAALLFAEAARPSTFGALWTFEPIVFPPHLRPASGDVPTNPLADGAERRRAQFPSAEAARANFAAKPPMSTFHPEALDGYIERAFVADASDDATPGAVTLSCPGAIEAHIYRTGSLHDAWGGFGRITIPVTVVGGDMTVMGPAMFAPLLADELPSGTFDHRPELGHFGPLEQPALLAEAVAARFADVHTP